MIKLRGIWALLDYVFDHAAAAIDKPSVPFGLPTKVYV